MSVSQVLADVADAYSNAAWMAGLESMSHYSNSMIILSYQAGLLNS